MRLMSRKRIKKRRTALYLVMLVVGIFLSTLVVQGINLRANCQNLAAEQSELEQKKYEEMKQARQNRRQK